MLMLRDMMALGHFEWHVTEHGVNRKTGVRYMSSNTLFTSLFKIIRPVKIHYSIIIMTFIKSQCTFVILEVYFIQHFRV